MVHACVLSSDDKGNRRIDVDNVVLHFRVAPILVARTCYCCQYDETSLKNDALM